MFKFFKRDSAQEKLKIPGELCSATLAGASNACNIVNAASFNKKLFNREDIIAEVCGAHVMTVISTMSRVEGFHDYLSIEDRFNRGAGFLLENLPKVLNRTKDPKTLGVLKSRGFNPNDVALMEKLLAAEKTFELAASYYMGIDLNVSDEDVLNYGRKYNPKLLALSSEQRSNPIFAYVIRCVRLSHLEDIANTEFRTSFLIQLNDTLIQAALDLERNVERLMPKS